MHISHGCAKDDSGAISLKECWFLAFLLQRIAGNETLKPFQIQFVLFDCYDSHPTKRICQSTNSFLFKFFHYFMSSQHGLSAPLSWAHSNQSKENVANQCVIPAQEVLWCCSYFCFLVLENLDYIWSSLVQ